MVYVHRKVAFATIIAHVRFLPGMNTISEGEMKVINNNKRFKAIFEEECTCGNMVVGGTVQSETHDAANPDLDMKQRAEKMAKEIKSVPIDKAKKLIKQCGDAFVLHALLKIDGRLGVTEAVEQRLAAIKNQVGSDLKPESKTAPEGDGTEFLSDVGSSTQDKSGSKKHTAIPALKNKSSAQRDDTI
jgi:hypothetical protein